MSGYWTTVLIRWIDEFVCWTSIRDRSDGIRIANINYSADDGEAFTAFTQHALRLIEQKDPRRYGRVRREIRYIANVPLLTGAAYRRSVRCCEIDFDRYYVPPEDLAYEWQLAQFAATIVHEATHGHLCSRGIPYTEETWIRVERVCHAEETRFLARLSGKHFDGKYLGRPFDAGDWLPIRNLSWWERRKAMRARIRLAQQQVQQKKEK